MDAHQFRAGPDDVRSRTCTVLRRLGPIEEYAVRADAGLGHSLHYQPDVGRVGLFDGLHRRRRIRRRLEQEVSGGRRCFDARGNLFEQGFIPREFAARNFRF